MNEETFDYFNIDLNLLILHILLEGITKDVYDKKHQEYADKLQLLEVNYYRLKAIAWETERLKPLLRRDGGETITSLLLVIVLMSDVLHTDVAFEDLDAIGEADLPHEFTDAKGKTSGEEGLSVLGAPDEVNLEVVDRVETVTVKLHG